MGCNLKTVQVLHIRKRVSKSRKDPDVWFGSTGHQELDDSVKSDLQSEDKTLRRWNLRDAVLLETFPVGDAQIRCFGYFQVDRASCCFTKCGRCLSSPSSPAVSVLAGDEKGQIQVWDTKSGKVEMKMSGHTVWGLFSTQF